MKEPLLFSGIRILPSGKKDNKITNHVYWQSSLKYKMITVFSGFADPFFATGQNIVLMSRSSHPEVFLAKGALKICSKFTGEHPCRSAIPIKLQSNVIGIVLRHVCSPVNLLHIFKTSFFKSTSGWLLLNKCYNRIWQWS